jgi:RimJ/RimL family protein N-acetyltransferase
VAELLEAGEFLRRLGALADPAAGRTVGASSALVDDLGLDSLGLVQARALLADLGADDDPPDLWTATAGELYDFYRESIELDGAGPAPPAAPVDGLAPLTTTGRVSLRAILDDDLPALYSILTGPDNFRFRFRGYVPSREQFVAELNQGYLAQFTVAGRRPSDVLGVAGVYNANVHDGTGYLAVMADSAHTGTGTGVEALLLLVEYCFKVWTFRKLYLETAEYNYDAFASGAESFFEVEGRLRDHLYYDGRHWDLVIASIRRERWPETGGRMLSALIRP